MTWIQAPHRNVVVAAVVSLTILILAGLVYAPALMWRITLWTGFGAITVAVLAALVRMLYAVAALETGYRPGAGRKSLAPASIPSTPATQPFPAPRPAMAAPRSIQLDEVLADLRAAQYLLSKVQASGTFREFTDKQKYECDHALEEVRALLGEVARDKAIQKFAS